MSVRVLSEKKTLDVQERITARRWFMPLLGAGWVVLTPPGHALRRGRLAGGDVSRSRHSTGRFDFFFFREALVLLQKLSTDGLMPPFYLGLSPSLKIN